MGNHGLGRGPVHRVRQMVDRAVSGPCTHARRVLLQPDRRRLARSPRSEKPHVTALLSVDNLSVEFRTRSGTVRALERVEFEVRPGEMVGIVGESGSGKSVTAYAILGLLDAAARVTSGSILFEG